VGHCGQAKDLSFSMVLAAQAEKRGKESCFEQRRKKQEQTRTSHYVRELEKLGYRIEVPA